MRDVGDKLLFVLLSPLWLAAGAICAVLIGAAFSIGKIPVVGVPVFLLLLIVASPFVGIWQWAWGTNEWFQRDEIEIDGDGITVFRFKSKTRIQVSWLQMSGVTRIHDPPVDRYSIASATAGAILLQRMTDVRVLLAECDRRKIPLECINAWDVAS